MHQLWCVTNGSAWLQRRKLNLAGLDGFLEQVFTSGDLGATKAEKAFHDQVARALLRCRERIIV
jgi:FMN phosphatase YigB (HAD superfamily)